jgi:hypothetical protein
VCVRGRGRGGERMEESGPEYVRLCVDLSASTKPKKQCNLQHERTDTNIQFYFYLVFFFFLFVFYVHTRTAVTPARTYDYACH